MRKMSLCAGLLTLGAAIVLALGASPKGPQELLKVSFKRPAVRSTLAQAIADLGKLAEVRVVVDWQGLMETGVKPETPLALPATESTLDKLMDQTLAAVATKGNPLACQAIDDRLVVTTQARALRKDIRLVDNGVVASRPTGAAAAEPAIAAGALAGGAKLQFDSAPLSDVVEAVRKDSKVNIHVNYTALETSGIAQNTPVTLNASNVTPMKALDLLVEQLSGNKNKFDSIYWVLDEGVVEITTGTVLDAKTVTRVIDMGDLLMPVPDAAGPRMNLNMQTQATGNGSNTNNNSTGGPFNTTNQQTVAATVQPAREAAQAKLIAIIQKTIGDDMWQPQGKGSITFLRNTMIVSQTRLGWLLLDQAKVLR